MNSAVQARCSKGKKLNPSISDKRIYWFQEGPVGSQEEPASIAMECGRVVMPLACVTVAPAKLQQIIRK
jgi:hypothetical protein